MKPFQKPFTLNLASGIELVFSVSGSTSIRPPQTSPIESKISLFHKFKGKSSSAIPKTSLPSTKHHWSYHLFKTIDKLPSTFINPSFIFDTSSSFSRIIIALSNWWSKKSNLVFYFWDNPLITTPWILIFNSKANQRFFPYSFLLEPGPSFYHIHSIRPRFVLQKLHIRLSSINLGSALDGWNCLASLSIKKAWWILCFKELFKQDLFYNFSNTSSPFLSSWENNRIFDQALHNFW